MIRHLRVTVLVDNNASPPLAAEHGLALWIEADGVRILLDTGQGPALSANAAALGVPLRTVQHIVLSHGHYDHTGGVAAVLELAPHANLYLHPDALRPRYSRQAAPPHRSIGIPEPAASLIRSRGGTIWTKAPTAIADGVVATGQIPRLNAFEQASEHFFLDNACISPDPLLDDQALFIDTPRGIVLLLGCAHSGVINTCQYVRALTAKTIRAIVGGMHLLNADERRLDATLHTLRQLSPEVIAPSHCTGEQAVGLMKEALPEAFRPCTAGCSYEQPGQSSCGWVAH
ncbi:MAG TPA: MBL fold metallo-hydrolase [Planctomycetota bacterium]|nr:MBL fold metallo-hydrolase [Planctomycetota bacterium]